MGFQNLSIIGNVGKNAERRFTSTGNGLLTFSVAVNEYYKGEESTTWFRVTVWGSESKLDYLEPRLTKGSLVYISGPLRKEGPQVYESGGEHRASYEITGYTIKLLSSGPQTKNIEEDTIEEEIPEVPF